MQNAGKDHSFKARTRWGEMDRSSNPARPKLSRNIYNAVQFSLSFIHWVTTSEIRALSLSLPMFTGRLRSLTPSARAVNDSVLNKNGSNGCRRSYVTIAERIHRVTMFKMPKAEDQQRFLKQARKMAATNQRVR